MTHVYVVYKVHDYSCALQLFPTETQLFGFPRGQPF